MCNKSNHALNVSRQSTCYNDEHNPG